MRLLKSRMMLGSALTLSTIGAWIWRRRAQARRRFERLANRVRGECREMPGLRLTFAQACRFWQLEPRVCEQVLTALIKERHLYLAADGRYIACEPQ